jgi:hypothetical protein
MDKKPKGVGLFILILFFLIAAYFLLRTVFNSTGEIIVDSFPKECEVYLNGELKGTTPLTIKSLGFGDYELKVSKDGYKEDMRNVVLDRNNQKRVIMVALEHETFTLQVNSSPSEAEVYIDGIKKGTTPLEITDLIIGKHFVEVRKENYAKWSKEVNEEDETGSGVNKTIVFEANLVPSVASITINSIPDGAKVIINGEEKGTTPFVMDNVEPGSYQILVIKDGYVPYQEGFNIAKGDYVKRDLALTKANTFLMIKSDPAGAKVYINGEYKGVTPYSEANLTSGEYSLRVIKDGYLEYSTEIEVFEGKTSVYSYPLLKLP